MKNWWFLPFCLCVLPAWPATARTEEETLTPQEVICRAIDMDLSAWPHLSAWLTRCLDRPAAREALALKAKADSETPADVTRRIARINRL